MEPIAQVIKRPSNPPQRPSIPPKSSETGPPSGTIAPSSEPQPVQADVCPACAGLGWVRHNVQPGHADFGKLFACDCQHEIIERRRFERLVDISGLLPGELELRFADVIHRSDSGNGTTEMLGLARAFVNEPRGMLTIWGGYGNGKTLILQAIVNEFRRQRGVWGTYVRLKDLIDHIRAGNAKDALDDARERYEHLRDVPILAIDECDGPRMNDYAEEFRRAFLDDRYRLGLARKAHTVLAMNCDPATLPGDIWDRLRDGRFTVHHNPDESMRPAMEWD